jgi:hypothetical protein
LGLGRGIAAGFEIARLAEIRRRARKCKNSGNEAKKYLKTKDITFLVAANCAPFARKSAPERSKIGAFCANEAKASEQKRVGLVK